ncbi:MAG TPA: DUF4396 domain-containing protein [Rhizomicrobium sp.]|nr:DUF4396 domain-containing protein [Rhizomicrobium sp.]
MVPSWLHILSIVALAGGFVCAAAIVADEISHPQHMWIMNVVWPVAALFGTVLTLWAYLRFGRPATHVNAKHARRRGHDPHRGKPAPFPVMVGKAAAHCGSGCCLGDICAEWLAFAVPAVAVGFGWHSLFNEKMFAVWILDYIFAFALGILFQYFTIVPMQKLSVGEGLIRALKADALSLSAWQIGMYGFMALAQFVIFRSLFHTRLEVNSTEFWFMMQIAMLAGFVTSYPVNWWLLRVGIKEKM